MSRGSFVFGIALAAALLRVAAANAAEPPGHVTGIGGIFLKSPDPKALAAWYRDVLGVPVESWGGAMLHADAPGSPRVSTWMPFPDATHHFEPSTRDVMVNFAVDDMDAMLARLGRHHVPILKQENDATGRFAQILDPDGTKVELWQPKP